MGAKTLRFVSDTMPQALRDPKLKILPVYSLSCFHRAGIVSRSLSLAGHLPIPWPIPSPYRPLSYVRIVLSLLREKKMCEKASEKVIPHGRHSQPLAASLSHDSRLDSCLSVPRVLARIWLLERTQSSIFRCTSVSSRL